MGTVPQRAAPDGQAGEGIPGDRWDPRCGAARAPEYGRVGNDYAIRGCARETLVRVFPCTAVCTGEPAVGCAEPDFRRRPVDKGAIAKGSGAAAGPKGGGLLAVIRRCVHNEVTAAADVLRDSCVPTYCH
jgi:hypothetical protein